MRKICAALALFAAFLMLSSFATVREMTGSWRWVHVVEPQSGTIMEISAVTMGMADILHTDLFADGTCVERKVRLKDGRKAAQPGEWKLESEGTVLSVKVKDTWTSMKILSLQGDTLITEMGGALRLVMVRESL